MDNSDQFLSDTYIQEDSEPGKWLKHLKKSFCLQILLFLI